MNQFDICFNCEYSLSEPHKFCPNCGAQLTWQISTPVTTDNQNAPHQTVSNSVESNQQSHIKNENIPPTVTTSHSTTNNTEAPKEKSNSYAEPTVEIRLSKPFMIGNFSFFGVMYGLIGVILLLLAIQAFLNFGFNLAGLIIFSIIISISSYYLSRAQIVSVKKECPYCREKNNYLISRTPHQCTFCQRQINIKWE